MIHRFSPLLAGAAVVSALLGDDPAPSKPNPPADFLLRLAFYGVDEDPLNRGEMLVHRGQVYFITENSSEVALFDPAGGYCELIALGRKVRCRVTYKRIEDFTNLLHKKLLEKAADLEKQSSRAGQIEARMTRDLTDPKFRAEFDSKAGRLRLLNGSVIVDAVGVAEPEAARLALIRETLAIYYELTVLRKAETLPPFTRVAALHKLIDTQKLRPTELSFLYRLAGPPMRMRWKFDVVPGITDNDVIRLARLDRFRQQARLIAFDDYEKGEEP